MSLDWIFGGPARENPDRDAAYLGPSKVFNNWPTATGPGMHTDEASSALPDMGKLLSIADTRALASVSEGTRENPTASDLNSGGGFSKTIAPRIELMRIAHHVTGMWGSSPTSFIELEADLSIRGERKRRNPLQMLGVAEEPRDNPRMTIGFWKRMELLEKELENFYRRVGGRYKDTLQERRDRRSAKAKARGKAPPKTEPRDAWKPDIQKMLKAVRFVRAQEIAASVSHKLAILDENDLPFGMQWGILAKGNGKLPFEAYSELPQATCPGAGACGVPMKAASKVRKIDGAAPRGWCYSFRAWRRSAAFTRQFLNTLANTVDREAAIYRGSPIGKHPGNDETDPVVYAERVRAAVKGSRGRVWQQYVKRLLLEETKTERVGGKTIFLRLFVDGDVGYEDSIMAWMELCRDVSSTGRDIVGTGLGQVSIYSYSKCWRQYLNVDKFNKLRRLSWPDNFTINMSSGSVYAAEKDAPPSFARDRNLQIATEMEALKPMVRGYFEAINLKQYVGDLRAQTEALIAAAKADGKTPRQIVVPMPKKKSPIIEGMDFSPERVRDFLLLQTVATKQDVISYFPEVEMSDLKTKNTPEKLMHYALGRYLDKLSWDPAFGTVVRRELRYDDGEKEFIEKFSAKQRARLLRALETGKRTVHADDPGKKALHKKALALVLHEALWSFGLGGSCPLICGNCSDDPKDFASGVHRCAAKPGSPLYDKRIAIGLH